MTIGLTERDMTQAIAEQTWLDPIDKGLSGALNAFFTGAGATGQQIKNLLHGTWLGHPLHPVLTDLPIGAWSTALVLDALETLGNREELATGADAAVAVGLAGAVGAALSGMTDWDASGGPARRIGLLHGLLNLGVTGIYGASLALRLNGARGAGRLVGLLGFGLANYTAYLGGHLVYGERLGVDHSAQPALPSEFVPVLAEAALPEEQPVKADARGVPVLLVRRQGRIHALADTCSHLGCSLADGKLQGDAIVCICHGSTFALDDGRVINGPATYPQPAAETRVRNGQIEVRAAQG